LASTSCKEQAEKLLECCLRGVLPPGGLPPALLEDQCAEALFRIVVEGLADRFERPLCDAYVWLFSDAIARTMPGVDRARLIERYEQVRVVRPFVAEARRVFVLSRVTLGADVAVTSVVLDAVKRRFPAAEIWFVGPRKNWELFAADRRIRHLEIRYQRGTLRERLRSWPELREALSSGDLVVDPDSRLTQLGLLPVCDEEHYRLFESRAYGASDETALPGLTARWLEETFGISDAQPYVAIAEQRRPRCRPVISLSLGIGENPLKRIADPFEEKLLAALGRLGVELWIDRGAGGEEAARVERAIERSGAAVHSWHGSFAGFAAIIAQSDLYVGYDSAGQHVAAACGVPLLSIFAGFAAPRMFSRWRPTGHGRIEVLRVENPEPEAVLAQAIGALERFALR